MELHDLIFYSGSLSAVYEVCPACNSYLKQSLNLFSLCYFAFFLDVPIFCKFHIDGLMSFCVHTGTLSFFCVSCVFICLSAFILIVERQKDYAGGKDCSVHHIIIIYYQILPEEEMKMEEEEIKWKVHQRKVSLSKINDQRQHHRYAE